jgi:hypothetical protein
MDDRGDRRIIVFTMGKTGSTALSHALAHATGERVFQVFRLNPSGVAGAERRFREQLRAGSTLGSRTRTFPFPGSMHLWESAFLVEHPPAPHERWDVVTSVREPVGQAVSAFFHALSRDSVAGDVASLRDRFLEEGWLDRPAQWFEREFEPGLGVDALSEPFDPSVGTATIERGAVRVLLLRQENFSDAPDALKDFLRLPSAVRIPRRNTALDRRNGRAYASFLDEVHLPVAAVEETYSSPLSRHFYSDAELAQLRSRWTGVDTAPRTLRVRAHDRDVPRA